MNHLIKITAAAFVAAAASSSANAAEILVNADITTSTTWTANNTYNLQKQIYVKNGASLTIEPGTIIACTTNLGGSLAVTRGSQIFAMGTKDAPIIMTSKADVATWTGGDPKTGVWREACLEWGNLTLMGRAYISEDAIPSNVPTPNSSNFAIMEGLVEDFPGDPDVRYGGGNDSYNAGTVKYVSLRYGGKVVGLNVELNGLSVGGIGRNTDLHHIDIMNNVDDGIEIWGGTVNVKYANIWNIGDDSFDIDQGWRGKAQFVCIVQGYSVNAAQGSGVGDNAFELDGAENSDWQPVTTATIYNATVIGQPGGDHGTAWRDNARVQFRNCIFMDLGERLIRNDNVDGDGGSGYGHNGTLTWAQTWTTNYNVFSSVNAPTNPAAFYQAQTSGKLAEMTDSVFYNNTNANAYTDATGVGVVPGNATNNNVVSNSLPIKKIVRGPQVTKGPLALVMRPVIKLDPRPDNDATVSVDVAPDDGFFTPAKYRGAFGPSKKLDGDSSDAGNWACGWTAADAFGYLVCGEQVRNPTRF
ncbi:MAG TPA: hypothetical protein VMT18_13035 [Planctomycetota bacterium]|nr:hypothetical protein [Planctomycetota bacterium]